MIPMMELLLHMNRYITESQKYDSCQNHPLFATKPSELAPNLPHESDSVASGSCGVPGCWHNKPARSIPSPAAPQDQVNVGTIANGKEGVQESSGPEARETPPRSSLPVSYTHLTLPTIYSV